MNYLKFTMIALALCLCMVLPVAATGYDYTSKYVNNDPSFSVAPLDASGWVAFSIIAGGAQDKTVWVVNKAVNATPFDCTFNPDKSIIAGQNPQYTQVKVPGSGTTGALQWAVGEFDAYLQNGNGNQCEHIAFKAGGGGPMEATHVVFQGAAVSQLGEAEAGADVYTIIEATYGATVCHDECRTWIPEQGHWEWVGGHHGGHWKWVVDVEGHYSAWEDCQQSVNEPELTKSAHSNPFHRVVCEGNTIDVTSNVQEVVDMGIKEFLFDNSAPHDGIYDLTTTTRLSQIDDPAVGIVKNVYIHYTLNGDDRTINTMEYAPIAL